MNIRNIVAFCILMQNGKGIMGKSPVYIKEKFKHYALSNDEDSYKYGLDKRNEDLMIQWLEEWHNNQYDKMEIDI